MYLVLLKVESTQINIPEKMFREVVYCDSILDILKAPNFLKGNAVNFYNTIVN